MRSRKKIGQAIFQLLKSCMVILFLFLYFLESSDIKSLHKFSHEYGEAELHSVQHEREPCHVAVYHKQRGGGCSHASHFVKEDKCSLCYIRFHSNPIEEVSVIVLPLTFNIAPAPHSLALSIERVKDQFAGRAPPIS